MNIYLSENIKMLRKQRGLTQEGLADLLGVTFQAVSKWERSESFPDVAMLPVIADFLGTTIDDLFGVDKAKNEEQINEYLELYDKECSKNRALTFEKFKQAVKEFPYDFRILVRYMELLKEEKIHSYASDFEETSEEMMLIYEKIQNSCTDDNIRIWSKRIICEHLIYKFDCLGFDEKYLSQAEEIMSTFPAMCDSREYLSMCFNRDISKRYEAHEVAIEELLYLLQNTITGYCYYDDKFSAEYKINVIKNLNGLFKIVDSDNKYSKNRVQIIYNYGHLGRLYFELDDTQNALKHLKICAEHAKDLDSHPDEFERIAKYYEKEKPILNLSMCERMTKLMTEHYELSDEFKKSEQFKEIIDIMK